MKEIINKGNLPNHLQLFAAQLGGELQNMSTKFYEMESIAELEINAVDIGYELLPAVDARTNRGFILGFDATEPQGVVTLEKYVNMSIYFVEATEFEISEWTKKIKLHKELQQQDMYRRRAAKTASQKKVAQLIKDKKGE